MEADAGTQTLGLAAEMLFVQSRRQRVRVKDADGRVPAQADVVPEQALDKLLAGLVAVAVAGQVAKGLVGGDKEGVVGSSRVEQLDQVRVPVDEVRKARRVPAAADELVDGAAPVVVVAAAKGRGQLLSGLDGAGDAVEGVPDERGDARGQRVEPR